jgi:putative membrane protein
MLARDRTTLAHGRTDLAFERTQLAHERTLMAWVRTGTSLISFGFTIYKFFDYLNDGKPPAPRLFGPREFAMAMIGIGLVALVFAILDHQRSRQALKAAGGELRKSLALVLAILIAGLGIFGFVLALLRR